MTVNEQSPPTEGLPRDRQTPDVAEALRTQQTFNRAQAAWLIALGYRWGYEARVDEENAGWPKPTVFCAGDVIDGIDQRAYRRQCDQAARLPRPGDHCGGPVPSWGDEPARQVAA